MSHAIVQDVAVSWVEYHRIAIALVDPVPDGLILHVAGPTDEGVRTIEVWETEEAWQRFRDERLEAAPGVLGGTSRREPSLRELRALQLVLGLRVYISQAERPAAAASEKGEQQ